MRRYYILTKLAGMQELVYCQLTRDGAGRWELRSRVAPRHWLPFNTSERAAHFRATLSTDHDVKVLEITETEVMVGGA
jgi:hypothetical protein